MITPEFLESLQDWQRQGTRTVEIELSNLCGRQRFEVRLFEFGIGGATISTIEELETLDLRAMKKTDIYDQMSKMGWRP
jgi:uridine phosphorylase